MGHDEKTRVSEMSNLMFQLCSNRISIFHLLPARKMTCASRGRVRQLTSSLDMRLLGLS